MIYEKEINGSSVSLRSITINDCNEKYLKWLNDPDVNKYLETRLTAQNINAIEEFVMSKITSTDEYLFAIIYNESKEHVGNIKLGPINYNHAFADISYFIGAKECWGKGLATEAICLVTRFAFENLNLFKCAAGVYENNMASLKALEKAGYELEGRIKKKLINYLNEREDHLLFGIERDKKGRS